ncbi:MAG TPA: M43 family zinc metalloprotease, partial [Adhaeribacter sp.]|nr:M43 family zinc metalloprotease [Adhaeribacter sp.]
MLKQLQQNPETGIRMQEIEAFTQKYLRNNTANQRSAAVVSIPVVVHVLYNTATHNISECQIQSQLDVLNEDFRKLNADNVNTPAIYAGLTADSEIQFVLARRDPDGNATTGITRTATTRTTFSTNDDIKFTSLGGHDAWDTRKYLNFWIAPDLRNGTDQLLGYAQFPGGPRATDGVVMAFAAFGSRAKCPSGVYYTGYDLGRTTTHEVGHLLNLRHIWGDSNCGNDLVSDTPTQQTFNFGCPAFPQITCGNQGDMSMNFMDYTNDQCMYMFTAGQAARMNATLVSGGYHFELTTSDGGTAPAPLPVELASLAGKQLGATIALNWETASEINNAFFAVEHSATGRDFTAVGQVKGNGTTNFNQRYNFTHRQPATGKNYYRLKQVDLNGNFTYSRVIVVESKTGIATDLNLYPNPVTSDLHLTYSLNQEQAAIRVELYDLTGKMVATYNEGAKR